MNLPLYALVTILITHWVGDYLLQFNAMANLKGESLLWLTIHVLLYSVVLLIISLFLFSRVRAIQFCLINGVLHFFTDLVTSKVASRYKSNPRIFFPIIGFDQLIHTVTLLATTAYIPVEN